MGTGAVQAVRLSYPPAELARPANACWTLKLCPFVLSVSEISQKPGAPDQILTVTLSPALMGIELNCSASWQRLPPSLYVVHVCATGPGIGVVILSAIPAWMRLWSPDCHPSTPTQSLTVSLHCAVVYSAGTMNVPLTLVSLEPSTA